HEHQDGDRRPHGLPVHRRRELCRDPGGGNVNTAVKLPVSSRGIAVIVFALAVIVAGAGWFVVVSPKRSQATKLAQSIQEKQSQLATAQHTGRSTLTPQGPTD